MIPRVWLWLVLALGVAWSGAAAAASGPSAAESGSAKADPAATVETLDTDLLPQSPELPVEQTRTDAGGALKKTRV